MIVMSNLKKYDTNEDQRNLKFDNFSEKNISYDGRRPNFPGMTWRNSFVKIQ